MTLSKKKVEWPARIFHCELEEALKKALGDKYSINGVAKLIDVTPITFRRILNGCNVSLENAMKLAKLARLPIYEIWRLK
jgi:plasmid maintenance system antidote protein VapI